MARWSGDRERWIFGEGNRYEDERRRMGGWQGGGREWDERGRERWMGGEDRGEEWRGGSRGDEWRDRDQERWTTGGEYGRRPMRGGEWERERDARRGGGYYGEGGQGERGRGYGEGWRGESAGEGWYGAGGTYGGTGGMYGAMGEGMTGMRRGGSGQGVGEYGGYGYGYGQGRERGEWGGERGWRDTSRDFGRDLRRHGDDEGPLDRMGDRVKEGWRKLTGKGPKGYKRSDERIREDVSERIARCGVNAEDVEVKVENGEVTLTGFVERREDKRMLEDVADDVFGVDEVNNHLRLRREERQATMTSSGTQQGTQGTTGQRSQAGTQAQPPGRH